MMPKVSSSLFDIISVFISWSPIKGAIYLIKFIQYTILIKFNDWLWNTCETKGLNWFLSCSILSMPFSTAVGNESNLNVWPVGAVSKTTTEKFILDTSLNSYETYLDIFWLNSVENFDNYFMTSEKLTASSMPGKEPTISCSIALPALKKSVLNQVLA